MRVGRRLIGAGWVAWLSGCGTRADPLDATGPAETASLGLSVEFLREIDRLGTLLTPRLVLYTALVVGVALVLRRALIVVIRVAWRVGWDTQRRLARARSYVEIGLIVVTALLLGRVFFGAVPLLSLVTLAFLSLVGALALPGGLQDLAAGVSLAGRFRFVEGDQIEVARHEGTVRHIGLLRTMLQLPDGRTLWLPNREVVRSAVHVGPEQQALPVTVPLPATADDPVLRERLRRAAHLSPYRRAGSRPTIVREDDGWVLSFQTWATHRPDIATRAVDHRLRALCQDEESKS